MGEKNKTYWTKEQAIQNHHTSKVLMELLPSLFPFFIYSVVDFGCGCGDYINYLLKKDYHAFGFEGHPETKEDKSSILIFRQDLSEDMRGKETLLDTPHNSLSIEVGEHIYPEYEDIFLNNITYKCNSRLVLSWAIPGQTGLGHVNERSNEYIEGKLLERGFKLNKEETARVRKEMEKEEPFFFYFKNTLMVYDRIK
jgi:hypothetical protein